MWKLFIAISLVFSFNVNIYGQWNDDNNTNTNTGTPVTNNDDGIDIPTSSDGNSESKLVYIYNTNIANIFNNKQIEEYYNLTAMVFSNDKDNKNYEDSKKQRNIFYKIMSEISTETSFTMTHAGYTRKQSDSYTYIDISREVADINFSIKSFNIDISAQSSNGNNTSNAFYVGSLEHINPGFSISYKNKTTNTTVVLFFNKPTLSDDLTQGRQQDNKDGNGISVSKKFNIYSYVISVSSEIFNSMWTQTDNGSDYKSLNSLTALSILVEAHSKKQGITVNAVYTISKQNIQNEKCSSEMTFFNKLASGQITKTISKTLAVFTGITYTSSSTQQDTYCSTRIEIGVSYKNNKTSVKTSVGYSNNNYDELNDSNNNNTYYAQTTNSITTTGIYAKLTVTQNINNNITAIFTGTTQKTFFFGFSFKL